MLAACKPLILQDFHKSFNDTPTKNPPFLYKNGGFFLPFVAKTELHNFNSIADHTNTTDGFLGLTTGGVPLFIRGALLLFPVAQILILH